MICLDHLRIYYQATLLERVRDMPKGTTIIVVNDKPAHDTENLGDLMDTILKAAEAITKKKLHRQLTQEELEKLKEICKTIHQPDQNTEEINSNIVEEFHARNLSRKGKVLCSSRSNGKGRHYRSRQDPCFKKHRGR